MRTRARNAAVLAGVLLVTLTGCGGSDEKPSAELTEITISCDRFADTAKKITDAQTEIYSGTGDTGSVDTLLGELDALKVGAPADVKAAITEMGDAFERAQQVMDDPTEENTAELAELGPKLSEDSQKITAYIVSECD